MQRKLAAILAADIVGYTRLMGADETETLGRLTKLRRQFLEPLVAEHHGRVVKLTGDGLLVEHGSVVDAITCAVAWQKGVAELEDTRDEDKRFMFRIGVNLGDVIVEGGEIHGDGVNIAARLESQAEPGGIWVSGDAYRQAKGKVGVHFEDLGERYLKNVSEPIRVYRVAGQVTGGATASSARKPLALPQKPSIAVLPFVNMSDTPEREYFSDGVTEDVITQLSRFRDLFVVARNSSFSYKGRAIKVQDIAAELGVRYVLEGSVQAAGDRIRVSAQLVDAESGHHIWAERYNRELSDIFAVQDEITQSVVSTVAAWLIVDAQDRAARKPTESLAAYDYVLRVQSTIGDTRENNEQAKRNYEKALELDPNFARAHWGLAKCHMLDSMNRWADSPNAAHERAFAHALKAVSLDAADSKAQALLGNLFSDRGEFDEARRHLERALTLNPNDAYVHTLMAAHLIDSGEHESAIAHVKTAMRLDPFYPVWVAWKLGVAYYHARRYEEAVAPLKEAIYRNSNFMRSYRALAATFGQLGRIEEAREMVRQVLADQPHASLKQEQFKYKYAEDSEHWLEGLRKAGFPE